VEEPGEDVREQLLWELLNREVDVQVVAAREVCEWDDELEVLRSPSEPR
jgi:hypothetical protein